MQYSPLKDKKFYTVLIDGVVTIVTFVVGRYFPQAQELALLLIGFFQAVAAVLLAGFFQADSVALKSNQPVPHLLPPKK